MLITRKEIQHVLGFKRPSQTAKFLSKPHAPKPVDRTTRGFLYDAAQVIAWLESQKYTTYARALTAYVNGGAND